MQGCGGGRFSTGTGCTVTGIRCRNKLLHEEGGNAFIYVYTQFSSPNASYIAKLEGRVPRLAGPCPQAESRPAMGRIQGSSNVRFIDTLATGKLNKIPDWILILRYLILRYWLR